MALILAGFLSIFCALESCRHFRSARAPVDTSRPYLDSDADAAPFIEGENLFCGLSSKPKFLQKLPGRR
jgi:hypothetical protein